MDKKDDEKKNKTEEKCSNDNSIKNFREMLVEEVNTEIKRVRTKKFNNENKEDYYKLLSLKLTESLNKLLDAFNQICKNKINNINTINIIPIISNIKTQLKLSDPINLNTGKNKTHSLFNIDNSVPSDKLSLSTVDSFSLKSSYKNMNGISNGNFINNKSLQQQTENFIKNYINNLSKVNYFRKHASNDLNENGSVRSSSVKPLKTEIYKNINLDVLKQKKIIKEISASKKRRLTNKSYGNFNKFNQKNNLSRMNKNLNRPQTIDKHNSVKLKVTLSEQNSNIVKNKTNTEIEYEFTNQAKKEIYKNISEILDKNKEAKMAINGRRSNVLEELINLQKKDNIKIDVEILEDTNKKNIEMTNNPNKENDIKIGYNKKCNIY